MNLRKGISLSLRNLSNIDQFGASKSITSDGVSDGVVGSPPATGYTVISAESLDDAVAKAMSHPHIKHGGEVSVHETIQVMP